MEAPELARVHNLVEANDSDQLLGSFWPHPPEDAGKASPSLLHWLEGSTWG